MSLRTWCLWCGKERISFNPLESYCQDCVGFTPHRRSKLNAVPSKDLSRSESSSFQSRSTPAPAQSGSADARRVPYLKSGGMLPSDDDVV